MNVRKNKIKKLIFLFLTFLVLVTANIGNISVKAIVEQPTVNNGVKEEKQEYENKKNDSDEVKKSYDAETISKYIQVNCTETQQSGTNGPQLAYNIEESREVKKAWLTTLEAADKDSVFSYASPISQLREDLGMASVTEDDGTRYFLPDRIEDGTSETVDGMIEDAEAFVNSADPNLKYEDSTLQRFSQVIFNIFLSIGILAAVVFGALIGIKLMTSSAEGKAEAKQYLKVYIIGCLAVFGALGIWKLVVTILEGVL